MGGQRLPLFISQILSWLNSWTRAGGCGSMWDTDWPDPRRGENRLTFSYNLLTLILFVWVSDKGESLILLKYLLNVYPKKWTKILVIVKDLWQILSLTLNCLYKKRMNFKKLYISWMHIKHCHMNHYHHPHTHPHCHCCQVLFH